MAYATPNVEIWAGEQHGEDIPVLVKVTPPELGERTPSNIVCVIDISGSMRTEVTIQSEGGATESNGLTMLDIARHGVRTILKTLGPTDRLSVVWFNHAAGTLFPLTAMTEEGQATASAKLDELTENGGTNIWQGLEQGLNEILCAEEENATKRLSHVMLLTDGQTSERASVMVNLAGYRAKHEKLPGTISTFGFGYGIDSPLLCELASAGDGTYFFIPDAGFVGTVFVNTMSNLLVTMATNVVVDLEPEGDGVAIIGVAGQCRMESQADGRKRVSLGTIQFGQSRDLILRMKVPMGTTDFVLAKLTCEVKGSEALPSECVTGKIDADEVKAMEVESQRLRCLYVDQVEAALRVVADKPQSMLTEGQGLMKKTCEEIQKSKANDKENIKALLEDAAGQSTEALSKEEWFTKWGCHYLPSIMFAHKVQQCNNFKDAGVQVYGGTKFKEIQDQADALFNTIPAPVGRTSGYSDGGGGGAVSMAAYNNRYGPCIDAACNVRLASGAMRRVGELAKGDIVPGPDGATAEVVCLLRTPCPGGRATLVELEGGCRLTPFHPVRSGGQWAFPADLGEAKECPCEAICSVMLRGAPALVVDGVPCVALGHGLVEGVAAHPYLGTAAVLEDLAGAPGFERGLVELAADCIVRDPATGLVCGLRY